MAAATRWREVEASASPSAMPIPTATKNAY